MIGNGNLSYWRAVLDEDQGTDGFPEKHIRTVKSRAPRRKAEIKLSISCGEKLLSMGKGRLPNLFILLLTGGSILLSKRSFSKDISYAVPLLLSARGMGRKNRVVLLRLRMRAEQSFRELSKETAEVYQNALKHQDIAEEELPLPCDTHMPLVRTIFSMEGLHDAEGASGIYPDILFLFRLRDGSISIEADYNADLYEEEGITHLLAELRRLFLFVSENPGITLSELDLLSEEEKRLLSSFQGKRVPVPKEVNAVSAFCLSAKRYPDKRALVQGGKAMSYHELDLLSDRIASFLLEQCSGCGYVGIHMRNCMENTASILGILKSGAAYVPIDPELPLERIGSIIEDLDLSVILTKKEQLFALERLQMESPCLRVLLCLDAEDIRSEDSSLENPLGNQELWEYVGSSAKDAIEGGGWKSSYTGEYLSEQEMREYADNVSEKMLPLLKKDAKLLEIGCASGLTMFPLSERVGEYWGTDLSGSILEKDQRRIEEEQIKNIRLMRVEAIEIDKIGSRDFDAFLLNSVIQCFRSYSYFRTVLEKMLSLSAERSVIFLGDVMDAGTKKEMVESLRRFSEENSGKGYQTKMDWSQELFFAREYFRDLPADYPEIAAVEISEKRGSIQNELTRYRYDVLLFIDKKKAERRREDREKREREKVRRFGRQYGFGILKSCPERFSGKRISHEDPAYVIYTSGTTGKPKGICIQHGSLIRFIEWNRRYYGLTEKDVGTRYAGVGFDASVWELFPLLSSGAELHLIEEELRLDMEALNRYYEKHHISFSFLPTQIAEQFMELENHSLRILCTGGDALGRMKKRSYRFFNNYGPTENTVITSAIELSPEEEKDLSIGRPIDNTEVFIVDPYGAPQPVGCPGELWIGGENLAKGYINRPELNRKCFPRSKVLRRERLYRSGDLAKWSLDGRLHFLGRIDGQVKISAFRIEVEEIETALCENSAVKRAVVRLLRSGDGGKALCAYIIRREEVSEEELRSYLLTKLPEYMLPSYILFMERFPVSRNGKINDRKLPDPRESKGEDRGLGPENRREERILQAFRTVLQNDRIGVTDNFFHFGGNSIQAIRLVSELSADFEIRINDLFLYQTVRELSLHITEKKEELWERFSEVEKTVLEWQSSPPDKEFLEKQRLYRESLRNLPEKLSVDPKKYKAIFLTGGTGFFGIHTARRLLMDSKAELYLSMRDRSEEEAWKRLFRKWRHYFGAEPSREEAGRLHIVLASLTKERLGLCEEDYALLSERTDCIINAAANVRHYGHYEDFSGINAELIRKLAELSDRGRKKEIHHISTIGVAEGLIEGKKLFFYTEKDGDLGQADDNYYTSTKREAERHIERLRKEGRDISIYRLGNLIADSESGIFQDNIDTNGFYKILRAMICMERTAESSIWLPDFSFIDQITDAFIRLLLSEHSHFETYHLLNSSRLSMAELGEILRELGYPVHSMSAEDYLRFLYEMREDPKLGPYVLDFILHSRLLDIPRSTYFYLASERTERLLDKLGFRWRAADKESIGRLLSYCEKVAFLPKPGQRKS